MAAIPCADFAYDFVGILDRRFFQAQPQNGDSVLADQCSSFTGQPYNQKQNNENYGGTAQEKQGAVWM